jgi:hypothetical protein
MGVFCIRVICSKEGKHISTLILFDNFLPFSILSSTMPSSLFKHPLPSN